MLDPKRVVGAAEAERLLAAAFDVQGSDEAFEYAGQILRVLEGGASIGQGALALLIALDTAMGLIDVVAGKPELRRLLAQGCALISIKWMPEPTVTLVDPTSTRQ